MGARPGGRADRPRQRHAGGGGCRSPGGDRGADEIDWDALIARIVSATGWTFEHVEQHVTLPQADALGKQWAAVPPPDQQLRRIALYLGLPDTAPRQTPVTRNPEDAFREALAAGLPIMEGRPDDPLLAFLDLDHLDMDLSQ